jgi:hypothetical protein
MPEPTTAPVTAEGLRERIEARIRAVYDASCAAHAANAALAEVSPVLERQQAEIERLHALKAAIADAQRLVREALTNGWDIAKLGQAVSVALDAPETPGDAETETVDRLAAHRDVMVYALRDALPYIEGWTAELTRNQGDAVIDAILDAVRKAETARTPGDAEEATDG